jgi:hypothetical protein
MDKDLEEKLISELEKSVYSVIDLKKLTDNEAFDNEINKLIKIRKKRIRYTMILMVICYISMILLFFPFIYKIGFADFLKGFLASGFFFTIIRVYQSRREYDKELFILNLLKEQRNK